MRKELYAILGIILMGVGACASAQESPRSGSGSPFNLVQAACDIQPNASLRMLHGQINKALMSLRTADALSYFCLAELMERVGDYRAQDFYEKAIEADDEEPNYELFYGDYLRNFRGAQTPLFPQAEQHYFAALRKLRQREKTNPHKGDDDTRRFILRGLSALYQRDGVTLSSRKADFVSDSEFLKRPIVFFSTINRAAQSDADLDRDADVRDYTSEVLFAESAPIPGVSGSGRLARPLTEDEVRGLVRVKKPLETLDRVRFRYKASPVFDVFYTHRQTDNDQVTNFFCITPTSSPGCSQAGLQPFNALRQNDYGITAQKPFTAFRVFDVSLTGTFDKVQRWGLIEFQAGGEESIKQYATSLAVSHFFGPDKANAEVGYAYQAIHPEVAPSQPNRDRQFLNGTFTYQVFRPLRLPFFQSPYKWRFETRGWDFFSGFLNDTESFPPTHVRRHDYFVGTSLRGIGRFDFTVQPTWFTSSVGDDPFQHNTQYRTNANVLFRIVDEERNAGITKQIQALHLGFLHLVIPFRDDATRAGPNYFENQKIGAELDSNSSRTQGGRPFSRRRGMTASGSIT